MSFRNYVFTLNNPDIDSWINVCQRWEQDFSYVGFGKEIAPTTGTPHWQGVARLKNKTRPGQCRRIMEELFGSSPHVEPCAGTFDQAKVYCQKEGDYHFWGDEPQQGKRSDIATVAQRLRDGVTVAEAVEDHPGVFIRYHRGLTLWSQLYQPQRDWKTEVIWVHGPTGTGKTRWIHEQTAGKAYWKSGRTKWWDGFGNESDVVIDDFRPSAELPLDYMLRLFDRYPFNVEIKGGQVKFNAKRIFVTAPWRLEELYAKVPFDIPEEDIAQLSRRVTEVHHFPSLNAIFANDVVETLNVTH